MVQAKCTVLVHKPVHLAWTTLYSTSLVNYPTSTVSPSPYHQFNKSFPTPMVCPPTSKVSPTPHHWSVLPHINGRSPHIKGQSSQINSQSYHINSLSPHINGGYPNINGWFPYMAPLSTIRLFTLQWFVPPVGSPHQCSVPPHQFVVPINSGSPHINRWFPHQSLLHQQIVFHNWSPNFNSWSPNQWSVPVICTRKHPLRGTH